MNFRAAVAAGFAVTAFTLSALPAAAVEPTIEIGFGLPELTHLRIGAFVTPRLAVQLYASNVVFNWLTGISVSGYFLGKDEPKGPPLHSMLVQATLAFNPLADPIRVRGGGETIASAALVDVGYALTTWFGLTYHATIGGLLYLEDKVAAAPNFALSIGWKF